MAIFINNTDRTVSESQWLKIPQAGGVSDPGPCCPMVFKLMRHQAGFQFKLYFAPECGSSNHSSFSRGQSIQEAEAEMPRRKGVSAGSPIFLWFSISSFFSGVRSWYSLFFLFQMYSQKTHLTGSCFSEHVCYQEVPPGSGVAHL